MSVFEIKVVSKSGTEFCEELYGLEGDSPLIISAYINVFKPLESWMETVKNTQEGDVLEILPISKFASTPTCEAIKPRE